MNKFLILLFILNNIWAIGLQGLIIPQNAQILAIANSGLAGNIDPFLNPASNSLDKSYLQYSLNTWFADIKGSQTVYKWDKMFSNHLSIQTWNAKDLELWDNSPDDSPLGTFSTHYVAASYSASHNLNTPYNFGFRLQTIYSHLFTQSLSCISLDFGTIIPINSHINLGAVIKNLGYEFNNKSTLPTESGIGASFNIPTLKTTLLTDLIYNIHGLEFRSALVTNWRFINIKFGSSNSNSRNVKSTGLSINYNKWKFYYGIYFHENSNVLEPPQFFDIRLYL